MRVLTFITALLVCTGFVYAKPMDSLRVETIKGQKFIVYKVDKSDNINNIVKRYKTTVSELNKYNEMPKNKVVKNQIIRIPLPTEPTKLALTTSISDSNKVDEAHANAQSAEVQKVYTHLVVQGDNVNTIAKKYKITAAQISKWNNLKSNKIVVGQILIVDESATSKPYYKLNGPEAQLPQNNQQPRLATADLIEQTGIAFIDETMQVLHADAPIGTIVKVINLDNNRQCLVRVSGVLDTNKYKNFILSIGKEAQSKLDINSVTARVKISYMLKP